MNLFHGLFRAPKPDTINRAAAKPPHLFGIRHHGPGSARSLLAALDTLRPTAILIEGPPEGEPLLPLLVHPDMQPPIALAVYARDQPERAAYFPFAKFSPEYQALYYGLERGIPVYLIDLPQRYMLTLRGTDTAPLFADSESDAKTQAVRHDPIGELARAAGYDDAERWWDFIIEQRHDNPNSATPFEVFEALHEAMRVLRDTYSSEAATETPVGCDLERHVELLREAHMRQAIRTAQRQSVGASGQRIAVVCGAWHVPALADLSGIGVDESADAALLRDLPTVPTEATWIPWTHGRLTRFSGYGAGVQSPGWYAFLWETLDHRNIATHWLTKAAQLLRTEDLPASPAQIIDAVRLAQTAALLRDRALPDLHDLTEAITTLFCFGDETPLALISDQLFIGETMGKIPNETPMLPLQRDLRAEQERLKLTPDPIESILALDLRVPLHLERSQLLHRLLLLGVPWGAKEDVRSGAGTYQEVWRLQWQPEYTIRLVERGMWGSTVYEAASAFALHRAQTASVLSALTALVGRVLLAALSDSLDSIVKRLEDLAALTDDVLQLMGGLPALVDVFRYGDVRHTHSGSLRVVVERMATRITLGLPGACIGLADDAAKLMLDALIANDYAFRMLEDAAQAERWLAALNQIVELHGAHGLLAGRACRILFDSDRFTVDDTVRYLSRALSADPTDAAAWLTGFLQDSGLILVHNPMLMNVLDGWVMSLNTQTFEVLLPLLRRMFSTFTDPELRQIGQQINAQPLNTRPSKPAKIARTHSAELDQTRADAIYPTLAELLGKPYHEAQL